MATKSAPASTQVIDRYTADPEIARVEDMTPDEVNAELRNLRIDPQPTIVSVNGMVAAWKRRKKA